MQMWLLSDPLIDGNDNDDNDDIGIDYKEIEEIVSEFVEDFKISSM